MTAVGACIGLAFAFGLARVLMAINSQLGPSFCSGQAIQ